MAVSVGDHDSTTVLYSSRVFVPGKEACPVCFSKSESAETMGVGGISILKHVRDCQKKKTESTTEEETFIDELLQYVDKDGNTL